MSNIETECRQINGLKYKMNICISANEVKNALNKQIRHWQNKVNLPGFRKGKVPEDYIRKNYFDHIQIEATEALIETAFSSGLSKDNLSPAGPPKMDFKPLDEQKDFKCELTFEVHPKVEVKKYEGFKVKVKKEEVKESQVDKVIEDLKKTHPLKKESKKDELDKSGSQSDVSEEDLWAQSLNEKDISSLRKNIKEHLKVKVEQVYQDQVREEILNQLVSSNPIDIPQVVADSQKGHIITSTKRNLKYQGKSDSEMEEFIKKNEKDIQKQSIKHAHVSYLIHALSNQLKLSVSLNQVHQVLKEAGHSTPFDKSTVQSLHWQMVQSKVLDYLISKANITS